MFFVFPIILYVICILMILAHLNTGMQNSGDLSNITRFLTFIWMDSYLLSCCQSNYSRWKKFTYCKTCNRSYISWSFIFTWPLKSDKIFNPHIDLVSNLLAFLMELRLSNRCESCWMIFKVIYRISIGLINNILISIFEDSEAISTFDT